MVAEQPQKHPPLPWPLVLAVLVGMVLLHYTAERSVLLALLGIALVAQRIGGFSLPPQLGGGRAFRVGVYALVAMVIGLPNQSVQQWYLKPDYTILVGHLLAAEIVIRAWTSGGKSAKVIIVLSALLLAMGCNTLDRMYVQLFVPIYAALIVASLRSQMPPGKRDFRFAGMRIGVAMLSVGLGFVMIGVLTSLEREIQIMAMNFVRRNARSSDIGLSMTPRLDEAFNLEPSMERVFTIDGPAAERHWRALAFDTYEDSQWSPSLRVRDFRTLTADQLILTEPDPKLEVSVLGDTFDVLPIPLNASGLESATDVDREPGGGMRFTNIRADQVYSVSVSDQEHHQGIASLPPDATMRDRLLKFPEAVDQKVRELAEKVAGEGGPMIRVARLTQYLRGANSYSLSVEPGPGDPLSDFILNHRAAHCEFFASALVVMSRAAGVPARMVTGFYAHEMSGTDRMIVRDHDAHAWAECWIDGTGWITMDATPSGGLPDSLFGPPSVLRRMWEKVVDFPSQVQKWLGMLSREMVLWVVFLIAVTVVLIGVVQLLRRKNENGDRPYAPPSEELLLLGRRFEDWLKRQGQPCPTNRTWREQLGRIDATQFVDLYDEARFGSANGSTVERLDSILCALESNETEIQPQSSQRTQS